eukprot:gnl/Chilomastix_caulleri/370.p1 GENE.gnl/Chilomastix_caulleri/370~~gnl/Chilomastix_caulleri/370.p1  ORF type:complete len:260 (+),score=86.60 gnl/Chilomastix_caulleri/370:62-841(+)
MGPFLRAAIRTTAICATAAAVHDIHHDVKKAEKRAKKAEKHAREAQMNSMHMQNNYNTGGHITVGGIPAQTIPVKPVMFHVNIMSLKIPLIQPGYPNTGALSVYYDQPLGGWRAAPRGTRPSSCDNRGAPHTFVTLPHYIAFAFTDINNQTIMLFSDKSCSACGEHCVLTAQQIPYQQIIAISHPQIMNEVGFQTITPQQPQPMMAPQPQIMLPGQPQPLTTLPPSGQFPPGMAPQPMPADSRDINPIYNQPPSFSPPM